MAWSVLFSDIGPRVLFVDLDEFTYISEEFTVAWSAYQSWEWGDREKRGQTFVCHKSVEHGLNLSGS